MLRRGRCHRIGARLDRLPATGAAWRLVVLLGLGFFFELCDLLFTVTWRLGSSRRPPTTTTPGLFAPGVQPGELVARCSDCYHYPMLKLDQSPEVVTFDCYGTLVQWHRAVRTAALAILSRHLEAAANIEERATALADRLRATAIEHQQRPSYRTYREVLRSSLDESFASLGFAADADDHATLLEALRRIQPHPEVPSALERLRARYRLAIISNTDDDLIAETVAAIGVPIDVVVTAQQARAYKPDHRLFLYAYEAIGVTKDQTVHVGMGQFTDLKVCRELGIRSVWIDRMRETLNPAWPPDAALPDLTGLPELLTSGA